MDLLFNEAGKRPVYWTIGTFPKPDLADMERWITLKGLVYELKLIPGEAGETDLDFKAIEKGLLNPGGWKIDDQFHTADLRWLRMVWGPYSFAVIKATIQGRNEFATQMLEQFRQDFPPQWVPHGEDGAQLAAFYYDLGNAEMAEKWMVEIATDLKTGRYAGYPNRELFSDQLEIWFSLQEMAETQELQALKKALPKKLVE
jgi:hypothetical protein